VYEEEGRPIIAYVSDGRAFEDECNSTDILVTDEPAPYGCWAPKLVVDLWDVRRNGAHAVWFEEDGLHVVTAAQVRGQRPWSKSPEPYAKKSKPKKKS
jgi:competence protein ComEC